jgi:hypothetical protein
MRTTQGSSVERILEDTDGSVREAEDVDDDNDVILRRKPSEVLRRGDIESEILFGTINNQYDDVKPNLILLNQYIQYILLMSLVHARNKEDFQCVPVPAPLNRYLSIYDKVQYL